MPRRTKGPRLYLRKGRADRRTAAVWVIRDGSNEISTGHGEECVGDAEQALADYINTKWSGEADPASEAERRSDPARVFVAEVIAYYATHRAPKVADPVSCKGRLEALLQFFPESTLADVRRSSCEAYVTWRIAQPVKSFTRNAPRLVSTEAARRELEDLSAAIGFWSDEFHLNHRPKVVLPQKRESPREALTRSEAAALLWAAMGWRKTELHGPWRPAETPGYRWVRQPSWVVKNRLHLRRFVLIGLYTGTRPGVIPKVLWHESPTQAWADLDAGTIYRRGKSEKDHRTKRRPMVRMPDRLLAHMKRWRRIDEAEQEKRAKRVGKQRVKSAGGGAELPPITTVLHHGGRALAGRIRTGFEGIVRDAGLPSEVTPHWLRHTCATWLMESEDQVPLWDAAAYTGMTVQTLEKCYGHHRPSHQTKARKALR